MKLRVYNINDVKKYKKVLREISTDVVQFDEKLAQIVQLMKKTNELYHGLGIAAPQIGVSKKIVFIDQNEYFVGNDVQLPLVLINPTYKAVNTEKEIATQECLSVPNKHYNVERYKNIFVIAKNIDGNIIQFEANGLLARCIQHECDHLQGKLICDVGVFQPKN